MLGVDGISDFEALCSDKHDAEVQLYAFDVSRTRPLHAPDQGQELGVAGDEPRGDNWLVAVTERSTITSQTVALTFDTAQAAVTDAAGGLISVEHPLDLLGVGRLGQRQHQQDTCLLRVKRI